MQVRRQVDAGEIYGRARASGMAATGGVERMSRGGRRRPAIRLGRSSGSHRTVIRPSSGTRRYLCSKRQRRTHSRQPYEAHDLFIETNATDGDAGLHSFHDGEDWSRTKLRDPKGRLLTDVKARGRLRDFGLTELFFEAAEPVVRRVPVPQVQEAVPRGQVHVEGTHGRGPQARPLGSAPPRDSRRTGDHIADGRARL
jgi:hypothetical protein